MYIFLVSFLFLYLTVDSRGLDVAKSKDDYLRERSAVVEGERRALTGSNISFTPAEQVLNETLMKWKRAEIRLGHSVNGSFVPGMHFFRAKKLMEQSPIFKLIQKMPKGICC